MAKVNINKQSNESLEIRIETMQTNLFVKIVLFVFVCISFAVPVIAATLADNYGQRLTPGFLITIIIFGGVGLYLFKLLLWNSYGSEIFFFTKHNFIIFNDYKLFKSERSNLRLADLDIHLSMQRFNKDKSGKEIREGFLVFQNGNNKLESSVFLTFEELSELKKNILNFINQK